MTKCFIFLMKSPNDHKYVDMFIDSMKYPSEFDMWITKDYQIVPGFARTSFADIQAHTIPTLRALHPHDIFMFLYRHEMEADFNRFIVNIAGSQWNNMVLGYADIEKGVGYSPAYGMGADGRPQYTTASGKLSAIVFHSLKHELAHLQQCGSWHDQHGQILPLLVRHAKASHLPWCMSK